MQLLKTQEAGRSQPATTVTPDCDPLVHAGTAIQDSNAKGATMALVPCPNCGSPISEKASVWPKCGVASLELETAAQSRKRPTGNAAMRQEDHTSDESKAGVW